MTPIMTQTVLVLLGITLGSMVSRQMIQPHEYYPLAPRHCWRCDVCSTFGSRFYLQRHARLDQTSAFLAESTGRAFADPILAPRRGADGRGDRRGADHSRDHPDTALPGAGVYGLRQNAPVEVASLIARRRTRRAGRRRHRSRAAARMAKFPASWMSGAMLASAVLHDRPDRGRPAAVDEQTVALFGLVRRDRPRFSRISKCRRSPATQ